MSGDSSASWGYITSIITTNVQHLDSINFYSHNDMCVCCARPRTL